MLKGRNFLKLLDFSREEINYLIDLSAKLKKLKKERIAHKYCQGLNMVLLFEKTSTRTRCAFEVAGADLGMNVTYLDPAASQMGKKESIADTAKVLGRMYDCIEYRGFDQQIVEDIAKYAGVVTFNGLTTQFHPTQMLADMLTIKEHFGDLAGRKLVFMGDCQNNVANSLMVVCAKLGLHYVACGPLQQMPDPKLVAQCQELALASGGSVVLESNVELAVSQADVIYTDIWVSMGEPESLWKQRIDLLLPYQVNKQVMDLAKPEAIFLHCLPSFHDLETTVGKDIFDKFGLCEMEVSDEVFLSDASLVFDQAENRLHTIKAVIAATMGDFE